jgi:hypothetical protein
MKISLLILLGLSMAFMVETGEARHNGLGDNDKISKDENGNIKPDNKCSPPGYCYDRGIKEKEKKEEKEE